MAFDTGSNTSKAQTQQEQTFQPQDQSQGFSSTADSGLDPLAGMSWGTTLNDLTATGGDVTGDAIARLITEQAVAIREKYGVQIVAHQTSHQNFNIGWSGVAIVGKKTVNNKNISAGVFLFCEDSVAQMAPRKVRINELGSDSTTFELPVHPINAWEDPDAQDVIRKRLISLSGDNNTRLAAVHCVPRNYVINDNTKENNINLIKLVAAEIIGQINKTAGRDPFILRGSYVKNGDKVVQNDNHVFKLDYRINQGPDPVDLFGNPTRADWTLTLKRTPNDNGGNNNTIRAFRSEQGIMAINGYTDFLYAGNEQTQYMVGTNTIPPSFIPVPVITNISQLHNNLSEFSVLALCQPLALFQNSNFLQKWEPSAVFDSIHNIGALNIQGIRPGGASGVRINTHVPEWNMQMLQSTFGGMIQPNGLICFDVNSFTTNGGILELLLMSTIKNPNGAQAKNILIKEFDRATAGRFSKVWNLESPLAQRMGVYPTGYWNYQDKVNGVSYMRDIRAIDYLAVCNAVADTVAVDSRVPIEFINDWNSTRNPQRTPDFQMYGTMRAIERVVGPSFVSTGHVHRIAVQASLLRTLLNLINTEFNYQGYTYSGMNISLEAQRVQSSGFSFDPGVFGQGLMVNASDVAFGVNAFSGNSSGSNMFNFGSSSPLSSFM